MRGVFSVLLLVNAWVSLLGSALYGWALYKAPNGSIAYVVVGAVMGVVSLLFWLGLRDWHTLTVTAAEASGEDRLTSVRHQLAALEAIVKAQAAQLHAVQQGVSDLHEGLSDVLEEVMNRLPESKSKAPAVAIAGLDLSKIPEAK